MDTFKQLIHKASYKKTFNEIHRIFLKNKTLKQKENFDLKFWSAWQELRDLDGNESEDIFYLVEVASDDGEHSFIDVCLFDEKKDEIFSLDFIDWSDLINMRVEKPDNLNKEQCLAYILWEITFWGFTNKEVSKERSKLKKDIENDKSI